MHLRSRKPDATHQGSEPVAKLEIRSFSLDEVALIRCRGDLDTSTRKGFTDEVGRCLTARPRSVQVDMRHVMLGDGASACLAELEQLCKTLEIGLYLSLAPGAEANAPEVHPARASKMTGGPGSISIVRAQRLWSVADCGGCGSAGSIENGLCQVCMRDPSDALTAGAPRLRYKSNGVIL